MYLLQRLLHLLQSHHFAFQCCLLGGGWFLRYVATKRGVHSRWCRAQKITIFGTEFDQTHSLANFLNKHYIIATYVAWRHKVAIVVLEIEVVTDTAARAASLWEIVVFTVIRGGTVGAELSAGNACVHSGS